MLAPATTAGVDVAGVAEGTGATDGEVWPTTVKASAIEQRQVKNVSFIGIFCSEMHADRDLDSRKTGGASHLERNRGTPRRNDLLYSRFGPPSLADGKPPDVRRGPFDCAWDD